MYDLDSAAIIRNDRVGSNENIRTLGKQLYVHGIAERRSWRNNLEHQGRPQRGKANLRCPVIRLEAGSHLSYVTAPEICQNRDKLSDGDLTCPHEDMLSITCDSLWELDTPIKTCIFSFWMRRCVCDRRDQAAE